MTEYSISKIDKTTYLITNLVNMKSYLMFATQLNHPNYTLTIASVSSDDPYSPRMVLFNHEIYSFNIYTRIDVESILIQMLKAFEYLDFDIEYPEVLINTFGGLVNNQKPQWRAVHGTFH